MQTQVVELVHRKQREKKAKLMLETAIILKVILLVSHPEELLDVG